MCGKGGPADETEDHHYSHGSASRGRVGRILGDDQDRSFAPQRLPALFKSTGTAADRPWRRTFIHIDTFAMKSRDPERVTALLLCELVLGGLAGAQFPPAQPPLMPEKTEQNVEAPCLQPSGLVGWEDYRGPLQKVVGTFARKLERKSAHLPHYKAGVMLCSLELNDKFALFVQDTFDPVSFLGAGFNAGIGQAGNQDPTFGPGAVGYGKRFGAEFVGQTSTRFFTEFAYPAIFAEDPRYYRLGHGSNGKRFLHAVEHSFIAHRDQRQTYFQFV